MKAATALRATAFVLAGCATSQPASLELSAQRHEIHAFCPLAVAHPLATLVRSAPAWRQMLDQARTLPPPYAVEETDFSRTSILVVALPSTPAPTTEVRLPAHGAFLLSSAGKRLDVTLEVNEMPRQPGTALPAIIGSPCAIVWLPQVKDVEQLTVRNSTGRPIAESRL